MGITPEEYLEYLKSQIDKQQSPVLESLESGPRMDTAPTVATQPAPVLESAPTLSSGNGSVNFSDLQRANGALSATEGDRSGAYQPYDYNQGAIAEPLPVQQATVIDGTTPMLQPNPNEQAGANFDPVQAPVDFAAMEAQNSKSPVLINTTTPAPTTTTAAQAPVLGGSSTSSSRSPILSRGAGNMTANARGSSLGMIPRGEALIRIGAAGYSGALQGDGLGAAGREYGAIQDANRKAEVAAAKQAEATRLAELRARGTGAGKVGGKEAAKNAKALSSVNDAMYSMQRGLDAIAESRAAGGNLTGIGGIFKGVFDNFTGDADANRRLILSKLRVDDSLLRVAETKGAISNKEMQLFLAPAPKNFQDEQIWVDWLNERMRTLRGVQYRLQTGEELPLEERSQRFGSSTAAPSNDSLTDQELSYINQS
jgi:hypothetical protein